MQSKTAVQAETQSSDFATNIPVATYRIQFNKGFTFLDALTIVPYLARLGISHIYASPFFKARPGSMHGYDIIDHQSLNPEIGDPEDFNELIALLKSYGMGLIVDFVPNHMGIGSDNPWWMDVLENGPASAYVDYFDIDWSPVKKELFGKVLIPILGDSYGKILASGQFKLGFDARRGRISLNYYEHRLPLDPVSYPKILGQCLEPLQNELGAQSQDVLEYRSILSALERLPNHLEPVGFSLRIGEVAVQTRRLAELCARNSKVERFIEKCLESFTSDGGDPVAMQRLHDLLEEQPYRLAYWRVASDEINYRRFFDVNDLGAIRSEDPRVFNDIHSLIFDMVAERMIDGIRIDHPDGLFDPEEYFARLQHLAADRLGVPFKPRIGDGTQWQRRLPIYVLAEKILAPFESLETNWLIHGTTGYDFMDLLNNLLVCESNEEYFTQLYEEFIGHPANFEAMRRQCKETILDHVLSSELNVLSHRLSRIAERSWYFRDFTLNSLRAALRNIVVHFPVYRTYISSAGVPESARQYIDWAVNLAKRHSALPWSVYDFVTGVLNGDLDPQAFGVNDGEEVFALREAMLDFAMRFQQFTSPIMAKSVEDTLFYRYNRLLCLNEVGGEPKRFGSSVAAFHRQNVLRQQQHPFGVLATSTHDTKRSEDVRARIAVLSDIPELWRRTVMRWANLNEQHRQIIDEESVPDRNDEYMIYQNIFGAFPHHNRDEQTLSEFKDRIKQYALKAIKESKVHTSWLVPNEVYENGFQTFLDAILEPVQDNPFLQEVGQFVDYLAMFAFTNSLVQTVLKLTCPGVPDFYQGTELWDFSLVDPDNRRPVDFEKRVAALSDMTGDADHGVFAPAQTTFASSSLGESEWMDGTIKMFVATTLLKYRGRFPELFTAGEYIPLEVTGDKADHIVAFKRQYGSESAIIVVPIHLARLFEDGVTSMDLQGNDHAAFMEKVASADIWGDVSVVLPDADCTRSFVDLLSNRACDSSSGQLEVFRLFATLPMAVLISTGS